MPNAQQLGPDVIRQGVLAARPAAGTAGRLYLATDVADGTFYRDDGAAWIQVGAAVTGGGLSAIADALLAAPAASFDIQNIPATYRHLLVAVFGAFSDGGASTSQAILCRFNNDAAANYDSLLTRMREADILVTDETLAGTSMQLGFLRSASGVAGSGDGALIFIPNYAQATLQKVAHALGGRKDALVTGNLTSITAAGWWRSTAAIDRITLLDGGGGNFITGSRATVYGLS